LRRLIQREVETPLARMMLSGEAPDGSAVAVGRSKAGGLAFTVRTGGFSD
jgi:ATP-dependent Clp protease ATP-binding subunit ClpA